jgi:hypothetical protein
MNADDTDWEKQMLTIPIGVILEMGGCLPAFNERLPMSGWATKSRLTMYHMYTIQVSGVLEFSGGIPRCCPVVEHCWASRQGHQCERGADVVGSAGPVQKAGWKACWTK